VRGLGRCELGPVSQHRVHDDREAAGQSDLGLAQEDFNTILAAYCAGEIRRLRIGLEVNAWIYAGEEHTPPGWGITWHLVPSQEREREFPEKAYGEVVELGWMDKDETASEATRAGGTAEQIRQSKLDAQIGQWFEDRQPKRGWSSQYWCALDACSRAALAHVEVSNSPLTGGENSFEGLLSRTRLFTGATSPSYFCLRDKNGSIRHVLKEEH
jgi:hypothetical protein